MTMLKLGCAAVAVLILTLPFSPAPANARGLCMAVQCGYDSQGGRTHGGYAPPPGLRNDTTLPMKQKKHNK